MTIDEAIKVISDSKAYFSYLIEADGTIRGIYKGNSPIAFGDKYLEPGDDKQWFSTEDGEPLYSVRYTVLQVLSCMANGDNHATRKVLSDSLDGVRVARASGSHWQDEAGLRRRICAACGLFGAP